MTGELARYVLPPVRFDGLSLLAVDPPTTARFWGTVLSAPVREGGPRGFRMGCAGRARHTAGPVPCPQALAAPSICSRRLRGRMSVQTSST
ncbi:hypothetical protein Aau02nite_08140 [Amorphoplanes auranticolor]|uniref:Glyoxalase-like domain-containing protein n=1 Tax=Actinoplanes auranticolor TaxID=47988 RepID=A0A919VGK5_9ACTN|nr:hypothetical protein Aau02nite_08140 [Actinoplanes auranticolor]